MPKIYSMIQRKKALNMLRSGKSAYYVSKKLKISQPTLVNWKREWREQGIDYSEASKKT